jgi:hypothetical protein
MCDIKEAIHLSEILFTSYFTVMTKAICISSRLERFVIKKYIRNIKNAWAVQNMIDSPRIP